MYFGHSIVQRIPRVKDVANVTFYVKTFRTSWPPFFSTYIWVHLILLSVSVPESHQSFSYPIRTCLTWKLSWRKWLVKGRKSSNPYALATCENATQMANDDPCAMHPELNSSIFPLRVRLALILTNFTWTQCVMAYAAYSAQQNMNWIY